MLTPRLPSLQSLVFDANGRSAPNPRVISGKESSEGMQRLALLRHPSSAFWVAVITVSLMCAAPLSFG